MSFDGLYVVPDGMEQSGRTSYRAGDSAEQVQRSVRRVEANAGSYGGATAFVNALSAARERHSRGAENAADGRSTMGDADHGAAAFTRDMESESAYQINIASGAVQADPGIARGM